MTPTLVLCGGIDLFELRTESLTLENGIIVYMCTFSLGYYSILIGV